LIRKNTFYCRYGVFKVRVSSVAHEKNRSQMSGLSKLNSVTWLESTGSRSTLFQASRGTGRSEDHRRARRLPE
jgi:hypothetical protein